MSPVPGSGGIAVIILGAIVFGISITIQEGSLAHWVPIAGGILVGAWAIQAIHRQ